MEDSFHMHGVTFKTMVSLQMNVCLIIQEKLETIQEDASQNAKMVKKSQRSTHAQENLERLLESKILLMKSKRTEPLNFHSLYMRTS